MFPRILRLSHKNDSSIVRFTRDRTAFLFHMLLHVVLYDELLQSTASLWKEHCFVSKRLEDTKKHLVNAGKTEAHQRCSKIQRRTVAVPINFLGMGRTKGGGSINL